MAGLVKEFSTTMLYRLFLAFTLFIFPSSVSGRKIYKVGGTCEMLKSLVKVVDTYNVDNTIVLIYDEELEGRPNQEDLISDLHMRNRILVTINLATSQDDSHKRKFGTSKQSSVLKSWLLLLYSRGKPGTNEHYTFIIWVSNPDILYTLSSGLHPGWKDHDRVIMIHPRNPVFMPADISEMIFWKYIPYILGLKKDEKTGNINAFTVYPYCVHETDCYVNLDVWSTHEHRFHHGGAGLFVDKFSSFHGTQVYAGFLWKEPFLIWGSKLHPYRDGLDWRLSKLVERKLNVTIKEITSEKVGRFENNTWTGMLRILYNGSIAFVLGGVAFTPERSKYFGFSRSYFTDSYTFISPVVKKRPKIREVISKPFTSNVWYHIFGAEVITTIVLFLIANIQKMMAKKIKSPFTKHDEWFTHLGNVQYFVLTRVFQKPCNRLPRSAALTWICNSSSLGFYMMGIVFITHLISNMTTSITVPSVDKSDKINNSGISLDIRDYEGELNDFLRRERPELLNGASLVSWFESCQSIKRVSYGSKIYMDTRSRLAYFQRFVYNKTRVFSFHLSTENIIQDVKIAWPMQKNWPFRKAFDRILSQAVESGLVHYWMGNFYEGRTAWDGEKEAKLIKEDLGYLLVDWSSSVTRAGRRRCRDTRCDESRYVYAPITMIELEGIQSLFYSFCKTTMACLILEHIWSSFFMLVELLTWALSKFGMIMRKVVIRRGKIEASEYSIGESLYYVS